MADDIAPKPAPTAEEIAAALNKHDEASDRVAVLKEFPWLADELNKRANQTKTVSTQ